MREALKLALYALLDVYDAVYVRSEQEAAAIDKCAAAITAIKEALAQPAQEPVTHQFQALDGSWHPFIDAKHKANTETDDSWPIRALYTTPQQRPWVSLTDEEEDAAFEQSMVVRPKDASNKETRRLYAKAIEQALKEKNFD